MLVILGLTGPGSDIKLDAEKSTLSITGTSSLHDWEMSVDDFSVSGDITTSEVTDLEVRVESKSMKSGKSIMDNKAYDAVNEKDFPQIIFRAKRLGISGKKITGPGILEIAGNKKTIDFSAQIEGNSESEMQLKGEVSLKMSDFNITPPTAMFGTLKTGDEVVIHYNIFLIK